jgi:hypothetical protein
LPHEFDADVQPSIRNEAVFPMKRESRLLTAFV